MADSRQLVQHIELFVDTSGSTSQQDASLSAIASLIKNDLLTIETLVKEMEMYLTTLDPIVRARGILLLAELITILASKPLDSATIHSLVGFFAGRLADWKALRGALVGCLALLRRKSNSGVVNSNDAGAVAQSYLDNLQVQALGQHDRKLSYELMECLLTQYPNLVVELGHQFADAICEAIDGEKDPQCLMLAFHIVDVLAQLFPDPMGPLANVVEDLFEILGGYFPIHFTHQNKDDIGIKRDDLSRELMLAFCSTPLFEPFVIPLLLEKLSSALPLAKIDSLKYLNSCIMKYGANRMEKHVEAIWFLLKDAIFTAQEDPIVYLSSEYSNSVHFQENEIVKLALVVLQKICSQSDGSCTKLIISDQDLNNLINSISTFRNYFDISDENRKKLHAGGCILYIAAKACISSCNKLFESFILRIIDSLGIVTNNPSKARPYPNQDNVNSDLNFGALYLCIELLAACKDLAVGSREFVLNSVSTRENWTTMLNNFSQSLTNIVISSLNTSQNKIIHDADADAYIGVKGLQILATFPAYFSPISKFIFEDILTALTLIITSNYNSTLLWRQALKALISIGSFVTDYDESEKTNSFMDIVVEKISSLVSLDECGMPVPLKLEAICSIGAIGMKYMLRVVQGFEEAISANLINSYAHGNLKSNETAVQLLEYFSNKVLPWLQKSVNAEEVSSRFAIRIWNDIENNMSFCDNFQGNEILDATMKAMKLTVGSCSFECQSAIIEKGYEVISCKESLSITTPTQFVNIQLTRDSKRFTSKDEWLISLFASTIIAAHPQARISNLRVTSNLFINSLLKGHAPSAQALGSLVNKLPLKVNEVDNSYDCKLEEVLDMIFNGIGNVDLLPVHAINGLAWIGKGLLMRGHEKAKDITMIFLKCLVSNGDIEETLKKSENSIDQKMRSAADAFHILISNSENCLNKKFHAVIRPLYQQRFFSIVIPVLMSSIKKSDSSQTRYVLYRAFGHVVSNTTLVAILSESKKLIPIILDSLSMLSEDVLDKDILYNLLLVFSGLLTDKNGQEAVIENAHIVINCLTKLVSYPYMMLVREISLQCLAGLSGLPHTRIYPMRSQVLRAIVKALDDPKRVVRQEAVKCRQAWASIA